MKYLKIHIIIVMSVIILWTLLEFIFVHVVAIVARFLWDFTIPRKIWSGWQQMERPNSIMPPVHDITFKDTILRRHEDFYDIFFE